MVASSVVLQKEIIHRHRRPLYHPIGFAQMLSALYFSSYFFFWLFDVFLVMGLVKWGIMSSRAAVALVLVYLGSFAVYKPHLERGWPFAWFLHSRFVDLVLGYYDATCIREGPPLDPKGRYLFTMSPHGIFGVCRAFSGGTLWTKLYPGLNPRWASFGGAFYIPGVREFSLCCGCLDASRPVLEKAIQRGENVILIPGGTRELMLTEGTSTDTKLVLIGRKGFVKLAIQHGLQLVPGYCFGEKWVHDIVLLPAPIRAFLHKRFKLAGCTLAGRWWSFVGKISQADGTPISLGYVWGAPLAIRHDPECPEEYVDEIHQQYMEAISNIFERNKRRFGYSEDEKLVFVSAKD